MAPVSDKRQLPTEQLPDLFTCPLTVTGRDGRGNKWVLYSKIHAFMFLLIGMALSYTILQVETLKPDFVLRSPVILELFFLLLCSLVLIFVVFSPKNWLNKLFYKGFFLSLLGFGFIFIYGSTQFVSKIVITTPGNVVDYIGEFIKIGGIAALVGGIVTFMKERNRAEEALQDSENKLKAAFEGSHDAITISEKGVLVDCNKRALELFGLNREEFMKARLADFSPPLQPDGSRSWEKSREYIQKALSEGFNSFEWLHQRKDGGTFPAEVHLTAYTLRGETVLQGNIRDISERKLTEQKLSDYTLELEQLYHQLDAELDKARQVHERILPAAFPAVKGLSFAAHYQPAQKMGGDFYDVLHTGNKLIFYLSDVSGHGLDGAMLSVFVKHTIKSYISFTQPENITPAAILHHLAEQFGRENYPEDLYVCSFMAVLDLISMELSYCSAGLQEALLVQLENGERLNLQSKGMFITSYLPVEILKLQDDRITLTPGSTIFCNTDGLTEQGSKGAYYRDKLPEAFFQNAHLPAQLVAQAVVDDFRKFNNGSLQGKDDITLLVLKVEEISS